MSIIGPPVLTGVGKNLCPPLVLGENINNTTGAWSSGAGSKYMSSDYYIPVDFTTNSTYTLSYQLGSMPSATRSIVYAYNSNKDFMGRNSGNSTRTRSVTSSSFTTAATSATGPIAYLRVKLYNATFTAAMEAALKLQVEAGSATTYQPRGMIMVR